MIQYSQFLLTNLMEQPEIPVRSQSNQGTNLIASILNSIKLCDPYLDRFLLWKSLDFYLKLLSSFFLFFHFLTNLIIMEQIST